MNSSPLTNFGTFYRTDFELAVDKYLMPKDHRLKDSFTSDALASTNKGGGV
jgi:hypothetical protein